MDNEVMYQLKADSPKKYIVDKMLAIMYIYIEKFKVHDIIDIKNGSIKMLHTTLTKDDNFFVTIDERDINDS